MACFLNVCPRVGIECPKPRGDRWVGGQVGGGG